MSTSTWATPKLQHYFDDYAEAHQTTGNRWCHYFGVPAIATTLLGLLSFLVIGDGLTGSDILRVDGGTLLLSFAVVWYLYLDWKIGIPFALFGFGLYLIGRSLPLPVLAGVFVVGWIVQLYGHSHYEKKSPSFTRNIMHIFVGPLWIFSKWVGYVSVR